jgi:prolipoprotein diacylglyceryl transferase
VIASIPSPSSGELQIGPLAIHAYGMMIALGVIAAVWLSGRRLEQAHTGTRDDMGSVAMWGVGMGIVGARLYHVATDWSAFSDDLGRIPQIWKGGLGIPGGLLFGIVAGLWAGRRRGISTAAMATASAPAIPLAQAIGRWGNWWNQELFGRATDLPWALEISDENLPAGVASGTTFHPTFLYESLWNLALCGALLYIDRRWKPRRGRLMALYLIGYAVGRFWVEGLRIDPAHESGGLRLNQWVALAVAVGALVYLLIDRQRHPASAEDVAVPAVDEADTADAADTADEAELVDEAEAVGEAATEVALPRESSTRPAVVPPQSGSDAG